MNYYIVLLCESLLLLFFVYLVGTGVFSAPYYPTSSKKFNKAFADLKQHLPKKGKFIDLGSGDGKMVLWASKNGYAAEGIEINPFYSIVSRIKIIFSRHKGKIINKNFYNHNFNDYDIVYMYLFPTVMGKLKNKLFSEMKPGSVIVSNTFTIPGVKEDEKVDNFYIYRIKNG